MFVVTLPPSAAKNPQAFTLKAKREGADILEIRTDLTPSVKPFRSALPLLVSVRNREHGLIDRLKPVYIDVETQDFASLPRKSTLILSFHDHTATPSFSVLKKIATRMLKEKPWAIKIVTFVTSYEDLATLEKLQTWLETQTQRSIVLGMGPKAHLSRITSPLRNVFTYATLEDSDAAAPGQLPMSLYALTKGRKTPALFGILGGSHITSSLSPVIHNALFQRHKIDALYSCFPSEDFADLTTLKKLGVTGISVTAPFKHDAFDAASKKEPFVLKLGVANTLVKSGKKWKGFITDSYGIREGYPELTGVKHVAILGAGGALPSAIFAVRSRSPRARITVFARDTKKARKMLSAVETKNFASLHIQNLREALNFTADAVICAISEDVSLALPSPASKKSVAIDLRYGKETHFMKAAKQKKFRVQDGTNMLIHQALKQFRHFTGKQLHTEKDARFLHSLLSK